MASTVDDLIREGRIYRQQGQYHFAINTLEEALKLAQTPEEKARSAGALGWAYYLMHQQQAAEDLLKQASEATVLEPAERATYAHVLGNLHADRQQPDTAAHYYDQALELAGSDGFLVHSVRLSRVQLLPTAERLSALTAIAEDIAALPKSTDQARLYLSLGEQARTLGNEALPLAFSAFDNSRRIAEQQGEKRLLIQALIALGGLYEKQGRIREALSLTQSALRQAQTAQDHDLLLNLDWQLGRLFRAQGRSPEALAAYRRAVTHVEAIRLNIPVEYHDGRSSFRETLAPIYLGLADLLLLEARRGTDEEIQPLLLEARDTVELAKQTELEDFLGDRCLIQSPWDAEPQRADPASAVLYPIILPDRLELLLDWKGNIKQVSVDIPAEKLESTVKAFAEELRFAYGRFKEPAIQLHRWLIEPIEAALREQGVHTLVVVPDGVLRLIPMAALYDGQKFLIERYATATSPALTLLAAAPGRKKEFKSLVAGLSEPGPVLTKLPWPHLRDMIRPATNDRTLTRGGMPRRSRALSDRLGTLDLLPMLSDMSDQRFIENPDFQTKLREALALPGVQQEIAQLRTRLESLTLLFNQDFTLERFKNRIKSASYPIIHIASHGIFGPNAETTFIMTYDDIIRIDELETMLKAVPRQRSPVELLTFSACQTAEGDDRAPLGFSGMALRANARSAVGTLWPVDDEAAYTLMTSFYRNLLQSGVSKSEALRQAQLELLKNNLNHPYFWAAFILVGDWS
jgi:CHAT domain-containing protein